MLYKSNKSFKENDVVRKSLSKPQSPARLFSVGFGMLLALLVGFTTLSAQTPDDCFTCHDGMQAHFQASIHAVIDTKGLAKKADAAFSCESCHGDSAKHIEDSGGQGNIVAFKGELPNQTTKACLACHDSDHGRYFASQHAKAGMSCTSCHSIHAKKQTKNLVKGGSTKSCLQCHDDIYSQFKLNERHRLQEGIMECTSCHNPHEPALRERLGGFKHETCLQCHVDKGGPFMYEHGASRIEGCSSCHEVHGSPNRHLLKYQYVGDLCFSCHVTAPSWHSRFRTSPTNCASCHSTIHGSNLSKIFLK